MLILLLHPQYDPACVGYNLYTAINKHTPHTMRHIVGMPTMIISKTLTLKHDLVISGNYHNCNIDELKRLVNQADILHFSQYDWTEKITGTSHTFQDLMHRKDQKIIFQGHGGAWLLDPDKRMELYRKNGVKVITCSQIDEQIIPEAEWMPNILGTDSFDLTPDWSRDFNKQLHASLASNCPLYKGGEIVSYVFEYLCKFGYDFKFEYVKNLEKSESIKIRKKHHITVDNWTQGFFGLAGLEGLAMGHIVFARLNSLAIKNWQTKFAKMPPIENVMGMDECAKVLRKYYNDRILMKERCIENFKWIEDYYTDEKIVKMWKELYES